MSGERRYSISSRARRSERLARHIEEKQKKAKPWERDDDLDTAESWPYFVSFRDARGSRRLERVRRALDERSTSPTGSMPTLAQVKAWHDDGMWRERTAAYDDYMASIKQEEVEVLVRQNAQDVASRHKALLEDFTEIGEHEAAKLAERARSSDGEVIKPGELVKVVDAAIKLTRLVHGESTENTRTEIDVSGMSDAALEELVEAGARAKGAK